MTVFNYIARDRCNRLLRGNFNASSPIELRSHLNSIDLKLVSFDAVSTFKFAATAKSFSPRQWLPVSSRDAELFLNQLAMMLRSGLRMLDALKALQLQTESKRFSTLLANVHSSISEGNSLSQSLSAHRVFPAIVVHLIEVGEQAGNLVASLQQSTEYMSRRRDTIAEIKAAITYPAVVITAAIIVASYLVLYVIPQLQTFLNAMGRELPTMTQSLMTMSTWLRASGPAFVLIGFVATVCFSMMLYTTRGKLTFDRLLLRLPFLGEVIRLAGTAGLASSLSILLHSGIRLVQALKTASNLQYNEYLASIVRQAGHTVESGRPLAPALASRGGFTPILSSMVEVAERAGHLDSTLNEVAKLSEIELKSKIKRISQFAEPVVILLAGSIVGYVYIAFFVALMSAGGGVR